jgi:hypothetical protein
MGAPGNKAGRVLYVQHRGLATISRNLGKQGDLTGAVCAVYT